MSQYSSLFTAGESGDSEQPVETSSGYHILLVDDEPNVLNALKRVFRQENYHIMTAGSGEEALKVMDGSVFQLIISDFNMPVMNGGELLRRVKKQHPETIRIMLTGHADTDAVMSAIKEGAVYKFILKPWNDDDLRVTVSLALEQHDLIQRNKILQKQNEKRAKEISELSKLAVSNRSQLAIMLHKCNLLNDKQVQELYKIQQAKKIPTIRILLDKEWVAEKKIRDILKKDLLVDEVSLAEFQVDSAISSLIPRSFCERQLVLPLKQENRRLLLAMADPMDMGLIDDLRFTVGLEIQAVMANAADIQDKITEVYGDEDINFDDLETLISSTDPFEAIEIILDDDDDLTLEDLLHGSDEPPAIRLVNAIILEAIRYQASDIHIHPRTNSVVVRYRTDGILSDKIQIPHSLHMSLVSRIKVMAELDITERRRPQDGRITVKTPMRIIDLRISTLPTINGEKIVMRLLDRNSSIHEVNQLGLETEDFNRVVNVIKKPQGIILATGPTGSGKTTTLYSLLQHNATADKNYVTIEDPVEYYLDMAGQVMVKDKVGLSFATVLRAILRQDPDVVLLGEIRDIETAEVAFNAALTGHLVFSTLHTNSAVATIARLLDLGLKPYIVSTALEAIIAQRLVRKICEVCRAPVAIRDEDLHQLGPVFKNDNLQTFEGTGCKQCNHTGYSGRIGIYEILVPGTDLKNMIAAGANIGELTQAATQQGMSSILQDAYKKVDSGQTTIYEVLRVLGPQVIE
ncbi:MAG: ATPase, T2SS/T4P/T4SS family [Gammaproteobacteria bacterium]|nr:ATPase, T2SS/T4P/T4SS family [Gammaproteobacteria bacterium]